MIKLAAFYKELPKDPTLQVDGPDHSFDYRHSLILLEKSFHKYTPESQFYVMTDMSTKIPLSQDCVFRSELSGCNLMESLVIANTNFVKNHTGKIILCGSDHLVNKNLDLFFEKTFDIGILFNGGAVNNTVVLINKNENNKDSINKFFTDRQEAFYNLHDSQKKWFGDQTSFEIVLNNYNVPLLKTNTKGIFESNNLKFYMFNYGEHYVFGCKKSAPSFNKQALLIDFKGSRKKWFNDIAKMVL